MSTFASVRLLSTVRTYHPISPALRKVLACNSRIMHPLRSPNDSPPTHHHPITNSISSFPPPLTTQKFSSPACAESTKCASINYSPFHNHLRSSRFSGPLDDLKTAAPLLRTKNCTHFYQQTHLPTRYYNRQSHQTVTLSLSISHCQPTLPQSFPSVAHDNTLSILTTRIPNKTHQYSPHEKPSF